MCLMQLLSMLTKSRIDMFDFCEKCNFGYQKRLTLEDL